MDEIDTSSFKHQVFSKTKFSMVIPEVEEKLKELKVENVVLMGIEVCIALSVVKLGEIPILICNKIMKM